MCPPERFNIDLVVQRLMLEAILKIIEENPEMFPVDPPAPTRDEQIDEYIEQLRDHWKRTPNKTLTQIVTQIAEYDPELGPNRRKIQVNEVSDTTFFRDLATYPHYARDGKIAESNPEECWRDYHAAR